MEKRTRLTDRELEEIKAQNRAKYCGTLEEELTPPTELVELARSQEEVKALKSSGVSKYEIDIIGNNFYRLYFSNL